jgi:predicted aspartyl protease
MFHSNKMNAMMRTRSVSAGFVLLAAVAGPAQAQDCSLKPVASLDMRTTTDGGISIPVKVQGQEFYFLVDTAGVESLISPKIVDKFQLPQRTAPTKIFFFGETVVGHVATVQDFSVGGLSAHGISFYVQPAGWATAGMIAPDLLRRYDVDLDFAGGKFNLISQDHCRGKVVYWTKDPAVALVPMMVDSENTGHIRIPVLLDGKKMEATVDTGADTSVMSMAAAGRYLGINEQSPGIKEEDSVVNGITTKQYRYPFKSLDFQGIAVTNPDIVIFPDSHMRNLGSDIILGVGIMRQLHMYIAYKESKMYLTAATAH